MRGPRTRWAAALLGTVLSAIGASGPTEGTGQFRSVVEVVQVQVSVVDPSGRAVRGLDAGDFELLVGGVRRELVSVYEMDLGAPTPPPVQETGLPRPAAAWRQWMLYFDFAFIGPRGAKAAQAAALRFVRERTGPHDLLSVATFTPVEGTRLLVPLTRDRRQVAAAIEDLGLGGASRKVDPIGYVAEFLDEGRGSSERGEVEAAIDAITRLVERVEFAEYAALVTRYAGQLGDLGRLLQAIRGRKHVLFFSQGFDDEVLVGQDLATLEEDTTNFQEQRFDSVLSPEERYGAAEAREELEAALAELVAADARVHVIEPSGVGGGTNDHILDGISPRPGYSRAAGRSSLSGLAAGTGGTITWNENDLDSALARVEESTRAFYVLSFRRLPDDPAVLDLDVRVTESEVTVSAPRRLATPPPHEDMNDRQRQARLAEYVTKQLYERQIPFDVAAPAFPGRGAVYRVPVVLEIPWSALAAIAAERGDGIAEIDLLAYVIGADETMLDLTHRHLSIDVARIGRSPAAGLPFRVYDLLWSGPQGHSVRLLLRETDLGLLSTGAVSLRPPAAAGLSLSGPVAIDADHPGLIMRAFDAAHPPEHKADGPTRYPFRIGERELTPAARVAAPSGGPLQLLVRLDGVTRPGGGEPDLALGALLRDAAGNERPVAGLGFLARHDEPPGAVSMLLEVQLPDTLESRGWYLDVRVDDRSAGASTEATLEIWIEGGG